MTYLRITMITIICISCSAGIQGDDLKLEEFKSFDPLHNPTTKTRLDYMKEIIKNGVNLEEYAHTKYGNFGSVALSTLRKLCAQYDALLAFPGIILRLDEFAHYVVDNELACGDPWQAAQLFSDSLGKVIVYRAINLNRDEFENVRRNGIQSDAIRQNNDLSIYNNISFPFELLRRAQRDKVRYPSELADRIVSLSSDSDVSRNVSMGLAKMSDIGKRNMYLFKIEMPKLENLFISPENARMCEYATRRNEEIAPQFSKSQSEVRPIICRSSFYAESIETFAEYLIEPREIKEYQKMDLTKSKIISAGKKIRDISQKHVCEEIDSLKTIVRAQFYNSVKRSCPLSSSNAPEQAPPQTYQEQYLQYLESLGGRK